MWLKRLSLFFVIISSISTLLSQENNVERRLAGLLDSEQYQELVNIADSLERDGALNESRLNQLTADAYYFLNDVPAALKYYLRAISSLKKEEKDTLHMLEIHSHAGFCHKYLGNYIEALPYYQRALKLAQASKDSLEKSNQFFSLGSIYMELGDYQKSRQFLDSAYKIDFARRDTAAIGYDLSNLGDLMMKLENYPSALSYYREAVNIKETMANNVNTETLRYGKLAKALLLNNQLDSAASYNELAIQLATEQNDSLSLAKHWIDKTSISLRQNSLSDALRTGRKAYSFFEQKKATKFQIISGQVLANAYMKSGRYQDALDLLDKLIPIANDNGFLEEAANIYLKKSVIREQMDDNGNALQHYKAFQSIKDSLDRMQQTTTTLLLEKEYQTAQKENQIALLEARDQVSKLELSQRRRTIILLLAVLTITIVMGVYVFINQRKKTQLKNELLTTEINELRLQIKQLIDYQPEKSNISIDQLNKSLKEPLSDREFEVLQMAMTDKNNSEIAEKIFISTNTVKYHLKNVYQKLGVSNRKEALKFAFQATSR